MQIAVFSDLHLGQKNALDRFARKFDHIEPKFLELLTQLEKSVDKIVLLGDIFETLKSLPGQAARELRGVLAAYPEIAKRVTSNPKYQLVYGNHDVCAREVLNAPEYYEVEDHKQRLVFFHGHQLDPLTTGHALVSRTGVWIGGLIERMGIKTTPQDNHIPQRDGAIGKSYEKFAKAAVALGKQKRGDVIVTGHTHHAIRMESGGQMFLNSGTCVAGRREMLLLDTARASYEVVVSA